MKKRAIRLASAAALAMGMIHAPVARATVYEVTAFGSSEFNSPWGELTVTGTFTSDFPLGGYNFTVIESAIGTYDFINTATLTSQIPPSCVLGGQCGTQGTATLTPSFVPTGPNTGTASFELDDSQRILVADGTYGPQSTVPERDKSFPYPSPEPQIALVFRLQS
jgi:hypothetical protein